MCCGAVRLGFCFSWQRERHRLAEARVDGTTVLDTRDDAQLPEGRQLRGAVTSATQRRFSKGGGWRILYCSI
jgi:hypothetical protein